MGNQYIVKWGNILQDNYNYGATISFDEKGSVSYSAPLMSPSLCIKNWYSQKGFHISRNTPYLPLLQPGKRYHLKANLELEETSSIQLKLIFFDRYNEMLDEYYFSTLEDDFVFPEDAVHYEIQLINKHHQWLVFHELVITENTIQEGYQQQSLAPDMYYYTYKKEVNKKVRLIFLMKKNQVQQLRFHEETDYLFCVLDPKKNIDIVAITTLIFNVLLQKNLREVHVEFIKEINYYRLPQAIYQVPIILDQLMGESTNIEATHTQWLAQAQQQVDTMQLAVQVLQQILLRHSK